jgi:hypothetical protein
MRTVHDSEEEEELDQQEDARLMQGGSGSYTASTTQEQTGIAAHKAVVGPDELVPGEQEPVPLEAEKLKGTKTLLMWLPAIFDVRWMQKSGICAFSTLSLTSPFLTCRSAERHS